MKKYFLINGSKFGSLFLGYTGNPDETHADTLIFIKGTITFVSRMATLAKKDCIYVNPNTLKKYSIVH